MFGDSVRLQRGGPDQLTSEGEGRHTQVGRRWATPTSRQTCPKRSLNSAAWPCLRTSRLRLELRVQKTHLFQLEFVFHSPFRQQPGFQLESQRLC